MKFSKLFSLCSLLIVLSAHAGEDFHELRTWKNKKGVEVSAKLVDFDQREKMVEIILTNGRTYHYPLVELSQEDQVFVSEYLQSVTDPVETVEDQPNEKKAELPDKFILRGVPMVTQAHNYCVPASATMIALFHGVKTDQDEVAKMSSSGSVNNQGTYPSDMVHAMEKLGFTGQMRRWKSRGENVVEKFIKTHLPFIKEGLFYDGPMYVSFNPGVFGDMGHGCVIIGYDDRKQKLVFHNPWGNEFEKDYDEFAVQAGGVARFTAPKPAERATEEYTAKVLSIIQEMPSSIDQLRQLLQRSGVTASISYNSRKDERGNQKFAEDTAKREGRKIMDLAMDRYNATIMPINEGEETVAYYYVRKPERGGARFEVRKFADGTWERMEEITLGRLVKKWPTLLSHNPTHWDLPMIELTE